MGGFKAKNRKANCYMAARRIYGGGQEFQMAESRQLNNDEELRRSGFGSSEICFYVAGTSRWFQQMLETEQTIHERIPGIDGARDGHCSQVTQEVGKKVLIRVEGGGRGSGNREWGMGNNEGGSGSRRSDESG